MTRLFRRPAPGPSEYLGLMLFLMAYLAIIGLTLAPAGTFISPDHPTLTRNGE